MGNVTSQTISSNQEVVNTMLQDAVSSCTFNCQNQLSNVTVIVIGGSGNISIAQECKMDNLQCIMSNSFDAQVEDILKSMLQQSATSMNGFSLDFAAISQNVDLNQYIQNQITQMMDSSCTFNATNDASAIYTYVQDHNGNVDISQTADITNSTCNMDNVAKAVTYNNETGQVTQKSTIINIFSLIFIAIIVAIVIAGIVLIVFIATGGVKTVAEAAGQASTAKGAAPAGEAAAAAPSAGLIAEAAEAAPLLAAA